MIRTLVDKMRRLILGPNLATFARMPKADVHQLLAIGSDEFLFFEQMQDRRPFSGAHSTEVPIASGAFTQEIQELRLEMAVMKERLTVLERINYQKLPKDVKMSRDVSL